MAAPQRKAKILPSLQALLLVIITPYGPKGIDWDSISLGQSSDYEIARRLGVTPHAVFVQRRKRNIPSYKPPQVDWDRLPFGMVFDKEIAGLFGLNKQRVFEERKKRGIRSCAKQLLEFAERLPLGQYPDSTISRIFEVSASVVARARTRCGIESFESRMLRESRQFWLNVGLGTRPDKEIAAELGFSANRVTGRRIALEIPSFYRQKGIGRKAYLIDWRTVLLGSKPDQEIAHELGVSSSCVGRNRLRLGIPSYRRTTFCTDWSRIPLGQVPDWMIAEQLGKSVDAINAARSSRGIEPFAAICKTTEGETCNYPEGRIDLFWHENNVPHLFQVRFGRYVADWLLYDNVVVEYSGWERHPRFGPRYKGRLAKKIHFYWSKGLTVMVVTPRTLKYFSPHGMPNWMRVCCQCGRKTGKLEHKYCRACYKREYMQSLRFT